MAVLIQKRRYGQAKPFGSLPRIDWSHPRAAGLKIYVYDLGSQLIDLVNGGQGIISAQSTPVIRSMNQFGPGLLFPGVSSSAGFSYLPTTVTAGLTGAALPYSVCFGSVYTAAPVASGFPFGVTTVSSANNGDTGVAWLSHSGTQLDYYWNNGDPRTYNQTIALNTFQTWGQVPTGATTALMYANGALDQSASSITSTTFSIPTGLGSVCYNSSTTSATNSSGGIYGFVPFFAYWNRNVTAAEFFMIQAAPWDHLIYPEDELFWKGTVAAAGGFAFSQSFCY